MAISAYTQPVRRTYMPFDFQPIVSMNENRFRNQLQMKEWDYQDAQVAETTLGATNQLLNTIKPWDEPDRAKLEEIRSGYLDPLAEKAKEIQARGGSFTELLPYIKSTHQNLQTNVARGDLSKIATKYTMGTQAMTDIQDYMKANDNGTAYANYALNNLEENGMRVRLPKAIDLIQEIQKNFVTTDSENKDALYSNAVRQLYEDYGVHSKIQFEGQMDKSTIETLKNRQVDMGNGTTASAYDLAFQQFVNDKATEAVYGKKKLTDVEKTSTFLRTPVEDLAKTHLQGTATANSVQSSTFNTDWRVEINPTTGKKEVKDAAGAWTDVTNWFSGRDLSPKQQQELSTMKNAWANYKAVQESLGKSPLGFEDYVYGMQQMANYNYAVPTTKEEETLSKMLWDPKTNSGIIRNIRIWDPETNKELSKKERDDMFGAYFDPEKSSANPDKMITVIGKFNSSNPYAASALLVGFNDKQWAVEIPNQNISSVEDLKHRAYKEARDKGYFKDMIGVDAEGQQIKVDGVWLPDEERVHFTKAEPVTQTPTAESQVADKTKASPQPTPRGGYWNYGDYSKVTSDMAWSRTPEFKAIGKSVANRSVNSEEATQIKATIAKYAQEYGVNPFVMEAMLLAESGQREGNELVADSWQANILNGSRKSESGAAGIAQFMPTTATHYGVDVTDVESSIEGNAKFMKDLLKVFNPTSDYGLMEYAIAAYNCGPGKLKSIMADAGYPYGAGPKGNPKSFTPEAFKAVYQKLPAQTKTYLQLILPYATRQSVE